LLGADDPGRWQASASGNGRITVAPRREGGVVFDASPRSNNRYVFPRYGLTREEQPDEAVHGLLFNLTVLSGQGTWSAIFEETNGSMYIAPLKPQPRQGQTVEAVAWLEDATWGAMWSVHDDDNKLDTKLIRAIRIGCNTPDKQIKFAVENIRWLRP
jgi:hypothetical protein